MRIERGRCSARLPLILLILAAPVLAQSNSLFRAARNNAAGAAPPSQSPAAASRGAAAAAASAERGAAAQSPASPQALVPIQPGNRGIVPLREVARPAQPQPGQPGAPIGLTATAGAKFLPSPPANPVLAGASLIAVQMPAVERIAVHDLVTIIIREDKRASSDATLQSDKEWKLDAALEQWFRLDTRDRLVPQNFPGGAPGARFDFKNEYDGQGKVDRKDTLITRITATVIDVKPNGNLVLEAKKSIKTDEELQLVTLTGTCRSRDVSADNTVLSTQVADMQINVEHSGAARDAARRGWLMKAMDFLRPF